MSTADAHSYSDLPQGKIKHIDFHIIVDFQTRLLYGRALPPGKTRQFKMPQPIPSHLFAVTVGNIQLGNQNGEMLNIALPPDQPIDWGQFS